ncbi:hypothetical protein ACT414_18455 (plasmid) [Acinetobacter baumannii]
MLKIKYVLMFCDESGDELICMVDRLDDANLMIMKQREDRGYLQKVTGNDYYFGADPNQLCIEEVLEVSNVNV